MTYGSGTTGTSDSLLQAQRRTAASIAAPGYGASGQNLDLALVLADEGPRGRADPAFDAHLQPIEQWAMAIWEQWLPVPSMNRMLTDAEQRLSGARSKWPKVYGPAAAMLATCWRLGWAAFDATHLATDLNKHLRLHLDSPAVVVTEVIESVKRWRWRRVERGLPQLSRNGSGRGPLLEPIWRLLKGTGKGTKLSEAEKGCLRSLIANRQFTQSRMKACGWADHDRCTVCLQAIVEEDAKANLQYIQPKTHKDKVEAIDEQIL